MDKDNLEEKISDLVDFRVKKTLAGKALREIHKIVQAIKLEDKRSRRASLLAAILITLLSLGLILWINKYDSDRPTKQTQVFHAYSNHT